MSSGFKREGDAVDNGLNNLAGFGLLAFSFAEGSEVRPQDFDKKITRFTGGKRLALSSLGKSLSMALLRSVGTRKVLLCRLATTCGDGEGM